jgi:hypothetical protein
LADRFPRFLGSAGANILKAEYFLPGVISELVNEQKARVRVLKTSEQWYGMTYLQDKPRVNQAIMDLVRQGVYPEKLWKAFL